MLKYVNGNKVFRAKILTKDVLKQQILTDSIAKNDCLCRHMVKHGLDWTSKTWTGPLVKHGLDSKAPISKTWTGLV